MPMRGYPGRTMTMRGDEPAFSHFPTDADHAPETDRLSSKGDSGLDASGAPWAGRRSGEATTA